MRQRAYAKTETLSADGIEHVTTNLGPRNPSSALRLRFGARLVGCSSSTLLTDLPERTYFRLICRWPGSCSATGQAAGIESPDLVGATDAARSAALSVALIEQPYRVAGRRSPAPAGQLDAAWTAAVLQLRDGPLSGLPILTGGRSLGARVACRTAAETDSVAVLCLAFPVHPPGRPENSRLSELDAVQVPSLVVQGENDPFGTPPTAPNRTVARIPAPTR